MGKRRSISPTRCSQIVRLHFDGWSYREIAKELQCSISACQYAVHNYEHFGIYKNQDRVGRPKESTLKQDGMIHPILSANRKLAAVDI